MTPHAMQRQRTVRYLQAVRKEHGKVPEFLVTDVAAEIERSPRTVWRWLAQAAASASCPTGSGKAVRLELDDDAIIALQQACGNVAKAHRLLTEQGADAKSLPTFRRAVRRLDPTLVAFAKDGSKGLHAKTLSMIRDDEHRNDVWALDCMECPVWVYPTAATSPVKPWLVTVIDHSTRYLLSSVVVFERPTAEHVIVALADAARIRSTPMAGVEVGGVPKAVRFDNGGEFKAKAISDAVRHLGAARLPAAPYRSWLNGRIERWHDTIQGDLLADLPGYTDGPQSVTRRDIFGLDTELLTEPLFVQLVMDWIETYNVDRTHSSLSGRTPLQAWAEDQTPLHRPDPEWLRLALLASGTRTVSGKGVRFDKIDYIDPGLAGLSGREVEVRYLPHDRSFVEVFVDGEWRCTARPHNTLTAEQQHELARIKREQYTTAANYAALAAQRRQIRAAQSRTTGPLRSHPDELSDEDLPESLRRSTPEATTHVDVLAAVFEHDMAPTDTATTTTYKSRTLPSQPQPTIPPPPSVPMPSVGSEPWELLADPSPKDHSR